ncbi:MAG: 50S ribosomal protein L34e [Candidatus Caldarchaeum sp.]|nr:50S ribosomal protein L34e [Candidatus Caldarchaeum sp.]
MRRSLRTRSKRRKTIKTPGGKSKLHFRKEKYGWRKCRFCGRTIHGTSGGRKSAHSEKSVERLYGGEVCPACLEKSFIAVAASEWKL